MNNYNNSDLPSMPRLAGGSVNALQAVHGVQQIRSQYSTALQVQKPRSLVDVECRLMEEADQAGEDFYFGWGAGKDRVEGPSIGLAMSAIRCWGNCAIQMEPLEETATSWIFTAAVIDLETGFTLQRQFRQSKNWTVFGRFDEARKEDIRFQIGQSKAARNAVCNFVPKWLLNKAMDKAKGGVREMIEKSIDKHGRDSVIGKALLRLAEHQIDEMRVLHKFGRPMLGAITVEDLVLIRGDISALEQNQDTALNLYPLAEEPKKAETPTDANEQEIFEEVVAADLEQPKAAPKKPSQSDTPKKKKHKAVAKPDDSGTPSVFEKYKSLILAAKTDDERAGIHGDIEESLSKGELNKNQGSELFAAVSRQPSPES